MPPLRQSKLLVNLVVFLSLSALLMGSLSHVAIAIANSVAALVQLSMVLLVLAASPHRPPGLATCASRTAPGTWSRRSAHQRPRCSSTLAAHALGLRSNPRRTHAPRLLRSAARRRGSPGFWCLLVLLRVPRAPGTQSCARAPPPTKPRSAAIEAPTSMDVLERRVRDHRHERGAAPTTRCTPEVAFARDAQRRKVEPHQQPGTAQEARPHQARRAAPAGSTYIRLTPCAAMSRIDFVDLPGYGFAQRSKSERLSWGP